MGLAAIRPLKRDFDSARSIDVESVAVGLAAIRPLKPSRAIDCERYESCSGFGRYQAVETGLWSHTRPDPGEVAVGLAAIRPLKHFRGNVALSGRSGCSGFGRYQAVETLHIH